MEMNFYLVLPKRACLIMFKNSIYVPTILTYYHRWFIFNVITTNITLYNFHRRISCIISTITTTI